MTSFAFLGVIFTYALIALCSVALVPATNSKIGARLGPKNPGYIYFKNINELKKHGFAPIKWIAVKKQIKGDMAKGRTYIQQPVDRFEIPDVYNSRVRDTCFVYSFAEGVELNKLSDAKSWTEKATFLPQVFYQVAQGAMYFRYANLVHRDLNIMVKEIPGSDIVKVTIIDYDLSRELVRDGFLKTNQLVPVEKLDKDFAYGKCQLDNLKLAMKIFRSVTGAFPEDFATGTVYPFKPLLRIFELTAQISPQSTPNQLQTKVLWLPTSSDAVAAKKLLNLLNFMAMVKEHNEDCLLPVQMLAPASTIEQID
ncbi:hypothetical protein BDF19DRAFT_425684 [Syncephalis fuscata]|nr:hypothetical protein BDF19DRAFT_425684 [Syncephalis fuscata]